MSAEILSCTQEQVKGLIANALTFPKRRGPKHGAQLWQKHHFEAKPHEKYHAKGTYMAILDRFQNDDVFHASQRQT